MFNCETCMKHYDRAARARKSCGFIPVNEWEKPGIGDARILMTSSGLRKLETCPGYTTTLPQVFEIADAWGWFEKGQLEHKYPDGVPSLVAQLVSLFAAENASAQEYYIRESSRPELPT